MALFYLALVAVGTLLLVGAGLGQVGRQGGRELEEGVQGRTVPAQRVVRRHKPSYRFDNYYNYNNDYNMDNDNDNIMNENNKCSDRSIEVKLPTR